MEDHGHVTGLCDGLATRTTSSNSIKYAITHMNDHRLPHLFQFRDSLLHRLLP